MQILPSNAYPRDIGVLYFKDPSGIPDHVFKLCRKDIPTFMQYRLYAPGNTGGGEDICVNVDVVAVDRSGSRAAYGFK